MDKRWILQGETTYGHVRSLFEAHWKTGTFLIWRKVGYTNVRYYFSVVISSSLVHFDLVMLPSLTTGFVLLSECAFRLHQFMNLMESSMRLKLMPLQYCKTVPVPEPPVEAMASGVVLFSSSSLGLGILVGKGSYGLVREGMLGNRKVAVKLLNPGNARATTFTSEVNSLLALQHPRVVGLLGVVTDKLPHYIILQFLEKGTLRHHLESNKKGSTDSELICMALQVAEGMEFISKKNYVLRNLCAQNVLLDSKLNCKIADLALARQVAGPGAAVAACNGLAVKHSFSFESVQKGLFTTKSDVWSFGILFMEVMSRGRPPYDGLDLGLLRGHLETGNRWQRPIGVCLEHYALMQRCWKMKPRARPTFQDLVAALNKLAAKK